jgi:hypothetical protein
MFRTQSLPSECDFRWLRLKRWFEPARDTPARPNRGETIFHQSFIARPWLMKLGFGNKTEGKPFFIKVSSPIFHQNFINENRAQN